MCSRAFLRRCRTSRPASCVRSGLRRNARRRCPTSPSGGRICRASRRLVVSACSRPACRRHLEDQRETEKAGAAEMREKLAGRGRRTPTRRNAGETGCRTSAKSALYADLWRRWIAPSTRSTPIRIEGDASPTGPGRAARNLAEDQITATPVAALSATLDRDAARRPGHAMPALWHWLYFLPLRPQSEIGPDGHAKRGGFLPPVALPRRMWAGEPSCDSRSRCASAMRSRARRRSRRHATRPARSGRARIRQGAPRDPATAREPALTE